ELDFFSIGSNDLLQYLMAADRNNASVKQSYNPYSQAFIKSLSQTVEAAKNNNISLSLCGEIGSDPDFLPILIGLGLRKISIAPSQVLKIKRLLSKLTIEKCEKLVRKIKTIKSEKEIKTIVEIGE
ncbi:MAG: putative PEP-binding protein, partial [Candidatus Izemoplasmatales bacterium]